MCSFLLGGVLFPCCIVQQRYHSLRLRLTINPIRQTARVGVAGTSAGRWSDGWLHNEHVNEQLSHVGVKGRPDDDRVAWQAR